MAKGRRKGSRRDREKRKADRRERQRIAGETPRWIPKAEPNLGEIEMGKHHGPLVKKEPEREYSQVVKDRVKFSLLTKIGKANSIKALRDLERATKTAESKGAIDKQTAKMIAEQLKLRMNRYAEEVRQAAKARQQST